MNKKSWLIGGEAGFGIMTTGLLFSKIASRRGYEVFESIEYPSLIRGGYNGYEVAFSAEEVYDLNKNIDCLVCLNQATFELNKKRLFNQSLVIFDNHDFQPVGDCQKISVPFFNILKELKGETIMKNTIALGASLALLGADLSELNIIIEEQFQKKGQVIIDFNKKFAEAGFNHVKNNYSESIKEWLNKRESEEKLVMTGNDVFSLASVIADCRLYVAYPMTPSSAPLATLASWQVKTKMIVRHAEDEISVINTALGGSFAGVRTAVATSGGGFALMVESVSLAGISETPIVIFLAQRPGPATGMPTWTEQGDLLFTVNAGHGEFPKIVLAPGGLEEMLELTVKAYDLADIYQTPVMVMSDMFLSENHRTISKSFIERVIGDYKVNRGKLVTNSNVKGQMSNLNIKCQNLLRYKITEDGISERLIPGTPGYFYQVNSYEHLEDGHTSEDSVVRNQQVNKRSKKIQTYFANDFQKPKIYGDFDKAELVFVCWGSTKRPVLEAQRLLSEKNKQSAVIHFTYIYPLNEEKIKPLFISDKHYILIENNSEGQFGKLLRQETGIEIKEKILKYDGRMFTGLEIINKLVKPVNSLINK